MKLIVGNWYKFEDPITKDVHIGQYLGRINGAECCICNKGYKAHAFNIWHKFEGEENYETWGYGLCHLPTIIKDLGDCPKKEQKYDWVVD